MKFLAHRGYWLKPGEQNSPAAFHRAFSNGFGVETDFRDSQGRLVISHDPPSDGAMRADDFIGLLREYEGAVLAANVKADGLQDMLSRALSHSVRDYFVFDMSIPDTLKFLSTAHPVFLRASEYETPDRTLLERSKGVWLDSFHGTWYSNETIATYRALNKEICIVSPELHKREHLNTWALLRDHRVHEDACIALCTDFPEEAREFFS